MANFKSASLKRVILFLTVLIVAAILYCVDVVSQAFYANETIRVTKAAIDNDEQDFLTAPAIAPLMEIMKTKEGEQATDTIRNLIDLKAFLKEATLKEFALRTQSERAKFDYGVNQGTLLRWKTLSEDALNSVLNGADETTKSNQIRAISKEINKVIVQKIAPLPSSDVLNQYRSLKNFIGPLPELPELFSNKTTTESTNQGV